MNRKGSIQFFFGWLLLLLFSFSITPRQLLHDTLADHADVNWSQPGKKEASVAQSGFNCDRLNLVAESPFIEGDEFHERVLSPDCTDFIVFSVHATAPKTIILPCLRGPPCI
ncbi:MAG TPA: hypothetical protein VGD17_04025 [Chitinophagaceae bacterium]